MKALLVVPSPKLQMYDVIEPVDLLTNSTFKGAVPEVMFAVKFDTGPPGATLMVRDFVDVPPAPAAAKVTVYLPLPNV